MKKFLSLFLSLAMVFAILPAGLFSIKAKAATSGYYTYSVSNGEATITDVDTSISGAVTIPSTLGGYPVTSIGIYAFNNCTKLTSITIPDSVKSIGESAFNSCTSITSVIIPDSVESIGGYVFYNCPKLLGIDIPNGVKSIGMWAFGNCTSLKSITIPNSVKIIGNNVFYKCTSLTSVIIPNSVTTISNQTFYYCTSLTNITIGDNVESIGDSAFRGCSKLTNITIPNSIVSIGNYAFRDCTGLNAIYITDVEGWCNITFESSYSNPLYYAENLYLNNELITELVIPDSVESVGDYAFYNCRSLTSINIPEGVTSIGYEAFGYCKSLTSIKLPEGVTSIGDYAFYRCTSLTSINIPKGVTSIGNDAFYYCTSLTSINIPEGVTSIGSSAFSWCESLTSINIPEGVTSIGNWAFYICTSLTIIKLPEGVTSIGDRAFSNCTSLTSINIPDSVTSIGDYAFYDCNKLKTVYHPCTISKDDITIGSNNEKLTNATWEIIHNFDSNGVCQDGVKYFEYTVTDGEATIDDVNTSISGDIAIPTTLGGYPVTAIKPTAFLGCNKITSVTIHKDITSIGAKAFLYCYALTGINVEAENENYYSQNGVLFDKNKQRLIHYPAASTNTAYTIPDNITAIEEYAFINCDFLISITIPDNVTAIGCLAFSYCDSLTSITISDNVTSIGEKAFWESVYYKNSSNWENNILYIGNHLIEVTGSISGNYTIKAGTKAIAEKAFFHSDLLTSVTIPDSVTAIGSKAFYYCTSLTSVTIPDSVVGVGDDAFYNCTTLTNVTIGNGVTTIGENAFNNCTSLTSVCLPDSVTSIGERAFNNTAYYNNSENWENNVLYIGNHLIEAKTSLSGDYTIKNGTKTIANNAFYYCSKLTSVYLPDSIVSIGSTAFYNCTSLKAVYHPCTTSQEDINIGLNNSKLTNATWMPEHNYYSSKVIAPTSTSQGYTEYTCQDCGDCYKDNFINFEDVVSGVKTTPSDVDITLSWDAYDGATEYYAKVYDKDFTKCLKTITTKGTSAVFDYKTLSYNTDYKFIVTAKLSNGKYLQVADAIRVDGAMVIGDRVVGHTLTMEGKGAVVSFLPVENATEYLVNVFENNAQGARIYTATLGANETTARIMNNLTAGTKYVVMINAKVDGKYMSLADLRINGIGVTFTAPVINPSSITIADETATSIRFNWDAVRGAEQYFIKVTEKESGKLVNTLKAEGKTTATLSRWTDGTRISPNTTYLLQFYTYVNSTTNSGEYGAPIEVTTKAFEPIKITARYNQNNNKINLTWNSTTNTVGYFVYTYKNGVKTATKYLDGNDNTIYGFTAPASSGTYTYGVVAYEKNSSGTAYTPLSMSNAIYL